MCHENVEAGGYAEGFYLDREQYSVVPQHHPIESHKSRMKQVDLKAQS